MIFLQIRDRIIGYFDNLRSDSYFKNIAVKDISPSRMQGWSDRNFILADLTTITKLQVKSLPQNRLEKVKSASWQYVAKNLSKSQILQNQNDETIHYCSANKAYKLFIEGKLSSQSAFSRVLSECRYDESKRIQILAIGLENLDVSEPDFITSLDYKALVKNYELTRSLKMIRRIRKDQITPEIANEIVKKLNQHSISHLSYLNFEAIDEIWKQASIPLTVEQRKEIELFIDRQLADRNFHFLTYAYSPDSDPDTKVICYLEEAISNGNASAIRTLDYLTPQRFKKIWENIDSKKLAPLLTRSHFVKLAVTNAYGLADLLGARYFRFLENCPVEVFKAVWDKCPHLHVAIASNMLVDPKWIIDDLKGRVLIALAKKYSTTIPTDYANLFTGQDILDMIDSDKDIQKYILTLDQIEYYLTHSKNEENKNRLVCDQLKLHPKLFNACPTAINYITYLNNEDLDKLSRIDGIREILSSNWNENSISHVQLAIILHFNPKEFKSNHWVSYLDRLNEKQFNLWLESCPKLSLSDIYCAFISLTNNFNKRNIERCRKLWVLNRDVLKNMLLNGEALNPAAYYAIPLEDLSEDFISKGKINVFEAVLTSLRNKLDSAEAVLKCSEYFKNNIIAFLHLLNMRGKTLKACLTVWEKWAEEEFKAKLNDPKIRENELLRQVEILKNRSLISMECFYEIENAYHEKMSRKLDILKNNEAYKNLVKAFERLPDETAIDQFRIEYRALQNDPNLKDLLPLDRELNKMCDKISEASIKSSEDDGLFEFFARLITVSKDSGITDEQAKTNREILSRIYKQKYEFIGDLSNLSVPVLDEKGVKTLAPVIARDALGVVDYAESLKRLLIAFPLYLYI